MSNASAQQHVKEQYERWPYPEPIVDLDAWLARNWQWFDPNHAARQLWPEGPPSSNLEILIAGCGTNQAAVFAINNPNARVIGIDISEAALVHHQSLKQRYRLENLDLLQLPIEQASTLDQSFDLIVSTGVLHHLDDPGAGLTALGGLLKPKGCMGLMLYARFGRIGVKLMQEIAQILELEANEDGLAIVKECLQHTDRHHPLKGYTSITKDLLHNSGMIDTFFPKCEQTYSVEQCLNLVADAGLHFQNWLFNNPYYPDSNKPNQDAFITHLYTRPIAQQWAIMERLNTNNACHVFMACKATRMIKPAGLPSQTELLQRIPVLRYPFQIKNNQLYRQGEPVQLRPHNQQLISQIDGNRTIAELCQNRDQAGSIKILTELWRLDIIALAERQRAD